jgi:Trk K+ transport system NAD-binding subunit
MRPSLTTTAPHGSPTPGAVLLAGDDGVPVRVREELAGAGVATVSICSSPEAPAARTATAAGARVVLGDPTVLDTWEAAGIATAQAIGLLGPDDLTNLNAALLVAEHTHDARIVVRLFSSDLAQGIERMLGGRGTVLSETEVAAPAFLRAALSGNTGQRITVAGRVLEVAEVDPADPRLVVALCNADTPTEVLPPRHALGALVLGLTDPESVVTGARGSLPGAVARATAALRTIPARALWLLLAIATVFASATAVFAFSDHLPLLDAVYFTATTMATVGYGDINLLGAPDWLKIFDIGLMAVSAILLASVLALVTDMLVSSRLDRALGRFPRPQADHVIVCGLGKAGAHIISGLRELGVPCIGVEQHQDAVGIAVARTLEVPVVFADARTPGTLAGLHVERALAVMAVTNDDLANLQCGLTAREHNPRLRVVLRIFDPRLAKRLDRSVELDLTRSVSGLAAPAFTAALLGRPLAEPLPLSNVALRVLETTVGLGSDLVGRTIHDLHQGGDLRILALDGRWLPREDLTVEAGAEVAVVGTRAACDDLQRTPSPA